jgi:hypothetical protein
MLTLRAAAHREVGHRKSGSQGLDAFSKRGRVEPVVVVDPNNAAVDGGRHTMGPRGTPLLPLSIHGPHCLGPRSPLGGRKRVKGVGLGVVHQRLTSRAQRVRGHDSGSANKGIAADTSSGFSEAGTAAMRGAAHDGQQQGVSWHSSGPGVRQNRTLFPGPQQKVDLWITIQP